MTMTSAKIWAEDRRGTIAISLSATRYSLPSLAGLAVADLDRGELAADGEIVVVEHQRARNAVLVELELDRIDRRLVAALCVLVEIAHRDRPALEAGERLLAGGGIGRHPLVRRDHAADDGERIVDLLALVGAVVDRHLEDALVCARGFDDAAHVIGRERHGGFEIEALVHRLGEIDGDLVCLALGVPVDAIDQRLVHVVLRLVDELLRRAVFPGGRTHVAEGDLAFAVVELRHLAELQRIAVAGVAREIVKNATARGYRRGIAARLRQLELVDRAVRGQLVCRRHCRCVPQADAGGNRGGGNRYAKPVFREAKPVESKPVEYRHRNQPPRRLAAQHRDAARVLQPRTARLARRRPIGEDSAGQRQQRWIAAARRASWQERWRKSWRSLGLRSRPRQPRSPITSRSCVSARCWSSSAKFASTRAASSSPRASLAAAYQSRTAKKRHAPVPSTCWRRSRPPSAISTRSSRWSASAASSIPIRRSSMDPR